jgi:hypothetical protein
VDQNSFVFNINLVCRGVVPQLCGILQVWCELECHWMEEYFGGMSLPNAGFSDVELISDELQRRLEVQRCRSPYNITCIMTPISAVLYGL